MAFELKQRVAHINGDIGHVEAIDGEFIDVRVLTPNNEPSCCITICHESQLTPVDDNVIPMPRSDEWWEESRRFCAAVECALNEVMTDGIDAR